MEWSPGNPAPRRQRNQDRAHGQTHPELDETECGFVSRPVVSGPVVSEPPVSEPPVAEPPVAEKRRATLKPSSLKSPTALRATTLQPPASLAERRAEERFSAEGQVELRFCDPISHTVAGVLMDYSQSGFRANHQFHSLHPGQFVEFRHLFGCGKARVMWNRISTEGVETGFFVFEE